MDQSYEVRLTDAAAADLETAVTWIKEDSIEAAQVFYNRIRKRIFTSLSYTPYMGVRLLLADGSEIMALTCGQYRLFYVVDEDRYAVTVVRILHTSRDIASIINTAA